MAILFIPLAIEKDDFIDAYVRAMRNFYVDWRRCFVEEFDCCRSEKYRLGLVLS